MPGGVGEQVGEDLGHAALVSHYSGQVGLQIDVEVVSAACAEESISGLVDEFSYSGGFGGYGESTGFDAGDVEEVVDETAHVVGLLVDDAEELDHFGGVEGVGGAEYSSGRAFDGSEWHAQFVAHHGEEFGA